MSTRDDIRAALKRHGPLSLTELATHCPSCDNDRQVVGGAIAGLRGEGKVKIFGADAQHKPVYAIGDWPAEGDEQLRVPGSAIEKPKAAAERAPDRAPSMPATAPSPARPAATLEEDNFMEKKTAVLNAIKQSDFGLPRKAILKIAGHDGQKIIKELLESGDIKQVGRSRGTKFVSKDAPARDALESGAELGRKPKRKRINAHTPRKGHGRKARARQASRNGAAPGAHRTAPAPLPPEAAETAARFAINEVGELGIEKEGGKLKLDRAEFERLRNFIERCTPILEGADA